MGWPGWDPDAPVPDGIGVLVLCAQLARVARISLDRTGWSWKGRRVGVTRDAVGAGAVEAAGAELLPATVLSVGEGFSVDGEAPSDTRDHSMACAALP